MSEAAGLFQVSTLAALAHGVNRGGLSVAELLRHGDLGIGTFDGLAGEMVVVDGRAYRVVGHEHVGEARPDDVTPYAAITAFRDHPPAELAPCAAAAELFESLDELRSDAAHVAAIRVDGRFDRLGLRVACGARAGETLGEAATHQFEATHRDVEATVVGFWTPQSLLGVDVVGYHLHAISADRALGGHLVDAAGSGLMARVQTEGHLTIVGADAEEPDPVQLAADLGTSEGFRDR